jgi:hypothetical protein
MPGRDFKTEAIAAGFTEKQAAFMEDWLAFEGHSHEIEDVDGLSEALAGEPYEEEEEEEEV